MVLLASYQALGLFLILLSILYTKLVSSAGIKWTRQPSFDDRFSTVGQNVISRSRIHCGETCTTSSTCASFFYAPNENVNCQLHNNILNSVVGLSSVINATYYVLEGAAGSTTTSTSTPTTSTTTVPPVVTHPLFSCPLDDTIFRTVSLSGGSAFTYKVIKQYLSQPNAKTECTNQGGFLARVTTKDKMDMLLDLVNCIGYSGEDYYVDGSNAAASDFYATNAWVMSNGDPVPMSTDFWGPGYPNYPASQHCLRMKASVGYKWDDCACSSNSFYFICEK